MDRNGYSESLIYQDGCIICHGRGQLVRHEVYHGAYRSKAKRLGCWVKVCPACHYAIHNTDGRLDRQLKEMMQREAMKAYGWDTEEFIHVFGKNYIEKEIG